MEQQLEQQELAITRYRPGAWKQAGKAVVASSAAEVASQAGLDWSVSLVDLQAKYFKPVEGTGSSQGQTLVVPTVIPIDKKKAVIKTTPTGETTAIGVVGNRYKPFQNAEIFGALDSLIDSGDARYAAAGEYDGGAKVWMLMSLPNEITVANDPHSAFLLAKTSHDGSSSVVIKPIIERLFCMNQINKLYRNTNKYTYRLSHTTNSQLSVQDIRNIIQLSYDMIEDYKTIANYLINKKVDSRESAINYFKKVFPLPSKIEETPYEMLSQGERKQQTNAQRARSIAHQIYSLSPSQENIRHTEFGLWQAVVEYADYNSKGKNLAVKTMSGQSDNIKLKALELLNS